MPPDIVTIADITFDITFTDTVRSRHYVPFIICRRDITCFARIILYHIYDDIDAAFDAVKIET
jgi:hypothetical protein